MMTTALGLALGYVSQTLQNQALMQENTERARMMKIQLESQKLMQQSAQLTSAGAPTKDKETDPGPDLIADQLKNAQQLMQAGKMQMAVNPKTAAELMRSAGEMRQQAMLMQREQSQMRQTKLEQLSGWVNQVSDQGSLDQIRTQVNGLHPGMWEENKLPTVYNENTASVFKHLAVATSTALQQAQLESKQIDLNNRDEYDKSRIEKNNAEKAQSEARTERLRQQIDTPKAATTAYDKYQTNLTKAEEQRATNVAKAQETVWFKDLPEEARAKELERIKKTEEESYKAKVTALNAQASKVGVPTLKQPSAGAGAESTGTSKEATGTSKIPGKTVSEVIDTLKQKNPGASEDELRAYAKSKGYIE